MADEPLALSTVPPQGPGQAEYEAICAAIMATARGRWFLEEYSRRHRNSDIGTVLAAIERIESMIQGEQNQQAQRQQRIELLEMARAIARTRAEVAELMPPPAAQTRGDHGGSTPSSDVVAAAERLQDVVWSMREQGVDPSTADQIEQLATTILSASALHNPADGRAQKLAEVLHYLGRRIDRLLEPAAHTDAIGLVAATVEALPEDGPAKAVVVPISATTIVTPMITAAAAPSPPARAPAISSSARQPNSEISPPLPADFMLDPLAAPVEEVIVSAPTAPPAETAADPTTSDDDLLIAPPPTPAPTPAPAAPFADDPFAAVRAMSDEERIALFS